jgi:hypothetical protein
VEEGYDPEGSDATFKEKTFFRLKRGGRRWTRYLITRGRVVPQELVLSRADGSSPRHVPNNDKVFFEDRDVLKWRLRIVHGESFIAMPGYNGITLPRRVLNEDGLMLLERLENESTYIFAWNTMKLWVLNVFWTFKRERNHFTQRNCWKEKLLKIIEKLRKEARERGDRDV